MLIDNKVKHDLDGSIGITTVWDFLKEYNDKERGDIGKLDIVTGFFTINTLSRLYEELPEENHYRIISSEMVCEDLKKDFIVDLLSDDMDISAMGNLDKLAKQAIAFLERKTVDMRAVVPEFCHAKAYLFKNKDPHRRNYYVTGSSNLTPAGIGLKPSPNVELNIAKGCDNTDNDYRELCDWYEEIWKGAKTEVPEDSDNKKSPKVPVKEYFIRKIKEYFRMYTPEEIYYKILYEMYNSKLDVDTGIEHKKDMSLLQTSKIWRTLFKYQQNGVISLIKMLRKYNGAILADAVGLGKTFSALAVIKYFQIQNYTTIVLCPKKLEQNWMQYRRGTNSRFEVDKFDYQVRFHTDFQNDRMQNSYETYKLDYLQSCDRVLVVIDESHNLRNEKSGRYIELLNSLIMNKPGHEQREVKVLMLSATPINTGLKDVKGQFKLIAHGNDHAFDTPDFNVESLDNTFKLAQTRYTTWCDQPNRTIGGFISMLPQNFFNLTDNLIVARTRKLIEKTLGEDLGFPQKNRPENVYQGVDHFGEFKTTEEIYDAFEKLSLTAYQPSMFLRESREAAHKEAAADWDDNIYRELFLVKMMSILFLKRLESSWYSCMTTIKKVLDIHEQTLNLVLEFETSKANGALPTHGDDDINDEDDDIIDDIFSLRKGEIKLAELKNLGGFKMGLQHDVELLKKIHEGLQDFERKYRSKAEIDPKLEELVRILNEKKKKPNKKVVIFTAYADTAKFLFDELKGRGFDHMASVSGKNIYTTGKHSNKNFNDVLQSFAPRTKLYNELSWDKLYEEKLDPAVYYKKDKNNNPDWDVDFDKWQELVKTYRPEYAKLLNDEIDILIATDCLSEGQNFQDADLQINYDIHWNPVRLIQRFGRIDRIGSPNKVISCVNFWPAQSFEDYLGLESRIQNRMAIMNLTGGETQDINEKYQKMVEDNPIQDKNADRLLKALTENSISDIESSQTLSMVDFSYETYRQDLADYFDKHQDFFRRMPNGVFSGFKNGSEFLSDLPDSLIALVGYPKKPEGKLDHQYTEFYLVCQPVDAEPTFKELNRAEVLEFLRQNKKADRFVPAWITDNDTERIEKLSGVLKQWMQSHVAPESLSSLKDKLGRKIISTSPANMQQQLREEHFQIQNFDLIVWEYVTKD